MQASLQSALDLAVGAGATIVRARVSYDPRSREVHEVVRKPIGSRPVLWHVMKYYAHFGFKDFILCLGYRAEAIKRERFAKGELSYDIDGLRAIVERGARSSPG